MLPLCFSHLSPSGCSEFLRAVVSSCFLVTTSPFGLLFLHLSPSLLLLCCVSKGGKHPADALAVAQGVAFFITTRLFITMKATYRHQKYIGVVGQTSPRVWHVYLPLMCVLWMHSGELFWTYCYFIKTVVAWKRTDGYLKLLSHSVIIDHIYIKYHLETDHTHHTLRPKLLCCSKGKNKKIWQ